jgi:predicted ATPase/transcriptional regulator with XRE-family HTH domain/Flp pilus assembly protein TadD
MHSEVSFGAWLRQRRKALDLTQGELADRVGCSVSAIRKIEADERRPSRQVAELLATALEIPPEEHQTFLKVARAELLVERLAGPHPGSPLPRLPTAPDLPSVKSPSQKEAGEKTSPPAHRVHGFPAPATPLLGREPELFAMSQLLLDPYCRLLTIIGPGGIGKTRLAIQVAIQQQENFPEGVYFVPLAAVASPDFLLPSIAGALDFSFSGSGDLKDQLQDFLRDKNLLLVLDNLEHLVDGSGILSEILQFAPRVKIVTTSRERLSLQGEWIFEIQGLPYPSDLTVEQNTGEYSAVALFLQCSRRAIPGFSLNEENRAGVLRICQLMEGMPLGIELAAAWVRVLTIQEIVQEIEKNLDFLATSARDAPERHRSLRAAFDHSWNLLSPEEAAAFRKISVFQGGFQRQAAAEVVGATLPLLSILVDKSLLRRNVADRYDMHQLVRQYAAEKLQEDPQERDQVEQGYCEYYLRFVHGKEALLRRERQAIEEIRAELENARSAWQLAVAGSRLDLIEMAAHAWSGFYLRTGLLREGETAIKAALELAIRRSEPGPLKPAPQGLVGKLLAIQADFLIHQGLYPQAAEVAREAIDWSQADQDAQTEALGHLALGQVLWRQSEFHPSLEQLGLALECARKNGWSQVEADCLRLIGVVYLQLRDLPVAMDYLEQALQLSRAIGDRLAESAVLNRLGMAYTIANNMSQARDYFQQALQIFSEVGDRRGEGRALNNLGVAYHGMGDYLRAKDYFSRGLEIIFEIGDRWGETAFLTNLGIASQRLGNFAEARRYFEQSILISREIDEWGGEAGSLSNIGLLAEQQGDLATAMEYQLQALRLVQAHRADLIESYVRLRMGRIYAAQGKSDQAIEAYQRSITLRKDMNRENQTVEPLVGLAVVWFDQGDLARAAGYVDQAVVLLGRSDSLIMDEADDSSWVYLSIYQVLRASGDPRAGEILAAAARQIEEQVAYLPSEEQRQVFLEARPAQQKILDEVHAAASQRLK